MNFISSNMFAKAVAPLIGGNPNLVPNLLGQISEISKTEISIINVPWKVFNGGIFWKNLAEYNGLQLQVNICSHHARILNSDDIRIVWGSLRGMEKIFDAIIRVSNKYK